MNNKTILENSNAAISEGNHEEFLSYLTENTQWTFMGDQTLSGKDEVRKYIADAYKKPPRFDTQLIIAEGDHVAVTGKISLWENDSVWKDYDYCDLWRFENGKMAELKAFVTAR